MNPPSTFLLCSLNLRSNIPNDPIWVAKEKIENKILLTLGETNARNGLKLTRYMFTYQ